MSNFLLKLLMIVTPKLCILIVILCTDYVLSYVK